MCIGTFKQYIDPLTGVTEESNHVSKEMNEFKMADQKSRTCLTLYRNNSVFWWVLILNPRKEAMAMVIIWDDYDYISFTSNVIVKGSLIYCLLLNTRRVLCLQRWIVIKNWNNFALKSISRVLCVILFYNSIIKTICKN